MHHTLANHWARVVELLYAAERMQELAADPEIGDAWFSLGNVYFRSRDYPAAIEAFRRALGMGGNAEEGISELRAITSHAKRNPVTFAAAGTCRMTGQQTVNDFSSFSRINRSLPGYRHFSIGACKQREIREAAPITFTVVK